jgi:hypothetical protein
MRNDARPIGEDSPSSPVGGDAEPVANQEAPDSRDSVKHDRQSHIVHPKTESESRNDQDVDATKP